MATVRIEDVKAAGIAVDVDLLARSGFESISDEDRYRLKTQGVCAQRQVGVFMLRIRVPGGKAKPEQLRRVADLADAYGHGSVHVTTRGGLEIHHVKIASVPSVWAGLAAIGLTTKGTCGDTIRNVIACAHAGTYAGEVLPPEPFVQLLHDRIVEISDATNISRKMNPSFACSPHCDDHVATSDMGFVATPDPAGGPPTFTVWGAGGLGATPRLAVELYRGLPQIDLIPAFDAIVAIGKKYADRSTRAKAKIKLVVDKLGVERVREIFAEELAAAKAAGPHPTRHVHSTAAARANGPATIAATHANEPGVIFASLANRPGAILASLTNRPGSILASLANRPGTIVASLSNRPGAIAATRTNGRSTSTPRDIRRPVAPTRHSTRGDFFTAPTFAPPPITRSVQSIAAAPFAEAHAAIAFAPSVPRVEPPPPRAGDVVAQKQADLFTLPALIAMGEISTQAARALADAAERYGDGIVHLTPDQNAEIQGIRGARVAAARDALAALGLRTRGRGGISDVVSCVGLEYCPLAVAHSMTMGEEIALAFDGLTDDARFSDFRIHVSGCPHSCAKHQVADIGLAGAMTEYDGARVEAYALYLGGNARERRLGATFPKKIPRTLVVPAIRALLAVYEDVALEGERYSATVARLGNEAFFPVIGHILDGTHVALPAIRTGKLVVIGNGMAGARFVEELRARASEPFEITVLGDEPHGGYNRIMLSGVLGGFRAAEEIVTHSPEWYAGRNVTLHAGARAAHIDRAAKTVTCADGSTHAYDALVIATGSRPFVPPIAGLGAPHVYVFRTLDDCARIRAAATGARSAIVLGGGLLGLEAASGLKALGVAPTVIHLAPTLMEQQLDAAAGSALRRRIEALGITVRANARAAKAFDDDSGRGIELADGERIAGDIIVVCCGIVANAEIGRAAGLAAERGIIVDDGLQTSDPSIFAIGECAQHRGITYGLVEPLWEQCAILADRLTRRHVAYGGSRVGTKLKVAGVNVVALGERDPQPGDDVIMTLDAQGRYRRAIARDGVLVGAQVVGDAKAAAEFARTFEAGTKIAGSLAAFVFGIEVIAATATPPAAGDERICVCNEVSRSTIQQAIDGGAHDIAEIGRLTLAGTGCGTCRGELASMVMASQKTADR